jgi:hypothetical protein
MLPSDALEGKWTPVEAFVVWIHAHRSAFSTREATVQLSNAAGDGI